MPSPHADDQEPEYRCAHCARLLYNDELARQVCRVCEDRAGEQLKALGTLYGQLASVLAPGAAPSGGRITSSKTAPLPVALQPLSLRGPGGIVGELQVIEDAWRTALGWTIAPWRGSIAETLPHVIKFLTNNVGWACDSYEEVSDDLRVISRLHGQATTAITGERDVRVPLGVCPIVVDDTSGELCGAKIRMSPWAPIIRCGTCGTTWGKEDWLRLAAVMQGFPVPGVAVA
jgi:phytoene dehydrogenase-like protein